MILVSRNEAMMMEMAAQAYVDSLELPEANVWGALPLPSPDADDDARWIADAPADLAAPTDDPRVAIAAEHFDGVAHECDMHSQNAPTPRDEIAMLRAGRILRLCARGLRGEI